MYETPRRVATETVTKKIDGVNTVIAQAGQVVPLAYDHLVPDEMTEPINAGASRSTSGRRATAAAASTPNSTTEPEPDPDQQQLVADDAKDDVADTSDDAEPEKPSTPKRNTRSRRSGGRS